MEETVALAAAEEISADAPKVSVLSKLDKISYQKQSKEHHCRLSCTPEMVLDRVELNTAKHRGSPRGHDAHQVSLIEQSLELLLTV